MSGRILGRIAITLAFVTFLGFVPLPDEWLCRESIAAIRLLWGGFLLFVTWRDMKKSITLVRQITLNRSENTIDAILTDCETLSDRRYRLEQYPE